MELHQEREQNLAAVVPNVAAHQPALPAVAVDVLELYRAGLRVSGVREGGRDGTPGGVFAVGPGAAARAAHHTPRTQQRR